ncbi:putative L-asparaginase 2 [Trichophaea hybrida]|nr:putative L-asparaginase 2 [Trichophaea hybrida]
MVPLLLLLLLCLAASALAIPTNLGLLEKRANTTTISYNPLLPNVTIYATGGTIAGSASSNTDTTAYTPGVLGVQVLINTVPELVNISNVAGVQFSNVASGEITPNMLLNLSQIISKDLQTGSAGAVITHGTDTLEETAFFLDLTIRSPKPVVLVGAMRPATAISADGPMNLLEAVTLAASPKAQNRGAMIVLNDRIGSAYYTSKTNSNSLDTFQAVDAGFLGNFVDVVPRFYYAPALPTNKPFFDISSTTALPKVEIIYSYQGVDPEIVFDAVRRGAKGLVIAGMGAGSFPEDADAAVLKVVEDYGTTVVYSHRTMDGYVPSAPVGGIAGGFFNPQKARYLLMLALNAGYDYEKITEVFRVD